MALFNPSSLIPGASSAFSDVESQLMLKAVDLADRSAGYSAPHPNSGCVIARGPKIVGEGFLYAQGTVSAEVQAVQSALEEAKGATAFLNIEPGDCDGDESAILALTQAGISRVVVGLCHPLEHLQGKAISALRNVGIHVDVLGEDIQNGSTVEETLKACKVVNAPLLYRAVYGIPFSVLKYAMTLDGKIAASSGHSAWVSSKISRGRVFAARGRSDAVIVGGNTVRRDNPRLTTRQEGGFQPIRIVMSRTLRLPDDADLWDVTTTQTIVMTQKGARKDFQKALASRGVEVVEFDFLTPRDIADYCYGRGFLSLLWECGGVLSGPAIACGIIHKVLAFVAPKIIGGITAPSPVGELGFVEMTQALDLTDVSFEKTGPDMLISGYLKPIPDGRPTRVLHYGQDALKASHEDNISSRVPVTILIQKPWDPYGALSNFSPHPISMPDGFGSIRTWKTVEHYFQAQRYVGVEDIRAKRCIDDIYAARSPEEAVCLGRMLARERPDLVRPDWEDVRLNVMYDALVMKFSSYAKLFSLLLSTKNSILVQASTSDLFWGAGRDGNGSNNLGRLLMKLRSRLKGLNSKNGLPNLTKGNEYAQWTHFSTI